ncbi:acyl-CoA/acyl-ACP dehydrogenase [Aetokthonos hydrillicola Thurmond2011]|jgi:alkylation response protein AidB-like acyl-CoA dehydrogenase|uniref:Acyl-CoA/acyl-ACP dehydrogenase n=1 Tax=Aetokthonos hydrillicola Thurmond2011 TaxID=2712845 RepID=A0AAP5I7C0_9CYAN|nr:acyl-CoA dehydrogenase family protein [Aetokthonos hydrillicola]MBO3458182.1 acyl-CoA/acyl-ACP dehydrogenase [Aetokthonos hydrillicola CCALA 1050]MBW4584402.1 acyl-CoA/acyl-ACP dehydrogenase [Aetokthonos hydrillicola CCALA 1050]MDR9896363.1 acyl-CoA/acyl-ACP dehydrogenase [Aetokthonos hydrillicola Thurmond2011]
MSKLSIVETSATKSFPDLFEVAESLARDFATRAATHDRDNSFPFENFEALHKAQLLSLTVPVEFGGQGVGYTTAAHVIERIASGDASTALVLTMHYLQHANAARTRRWNPSVYERLCRESVEGIALINAARVEPELGTPARGGLPATLAKRTSDGWQLTGHKQYTTGSPILRYFVVWARTDDSEPQVGNFLVPRDRPGVKIVETWDHLGMRATGSHDLILDNVLIPPEYLLDVRPPKAWAPPDPLTMAGNSLLLSALYQGVATAARDWLVSYLHQRSPSNLGSSLANLPRFQTCVGEIEALLYANNRLIYTLASDIDKGQHDTSVNLQAQTVKYLATNNAIRSVEIAVKLIGNPGLFKTNPLERHYRDVLCSRIHTPQDDAVCLALGKSALFK